MYAAERRRHGLKNRSAVSVCQDKDGRACARRPPVLQMGNPEVWKRGKFPRMLRINASAGHGRIFKSGIVYTHRNDLYVL